MWKTKYLEKQALRKAEFIQNRETWAYKRGDLYYVTLNPFRGSEQGGCRPVLVVQNNAGNNCSSTLIVAPLTSKIYKKDKYTDSSPLEYFMLAKGKRSIHQETPE